MITSSSLIFQCLTGIPTPGLRRANSEEELELFSWLAVRGVSEGTADPEHSGVLITLLDRFKIHT